MLSTPGVGSGLDISGIIDQLLAIEQQPLVQLGADQIELQAQLSAFGQLKSTVSLFSSTMTELKEPEKFRQTKALVSDTEILTASSDSSAAKGAYNIAVERIAENHRLAAGTVFADTDTTEVGLAGDTMTIEVGSPEDAFTIDIGEKTLGEVRDAINAASDNQGVTASILKDDTGSYLILSADDTGSDNFISLTYSGADPFSFNSLNQDRDGSLSFDADDLDAVVTLENTFTITSTDNSITDAITGVSLTLEKAGSVTLDVTRDNAAIQSSVQQFIGLYNEVVGTMIEMRGDILADERSALISLESQFRSVLNTPAGDSEKFDFLFELGVSTGLDGTLSLDSSVFNSALDNDPIGVADMFTNAESGLAVRMDELASSLISAGGLLDVREQSLDSRIRDLEDDRTRLEFRLVQKEASLVQQFSALDALIANLTTTSSFLQTQLDQIAAVSQSSNSN